MLLLIPFTVLLSSYSDGPPPARTGAPGELTCINGYCHNSYSLNSGLGTVTLSKDESNGWIPGKTYSLQLSVSDTAMRAFGFSISARVSGTKNQAGTWDLGPDVQIVTENLLEYLMHDTVQLAEGRGEWKFDWIAPDSLYGPVDFFVATVAANANGNRHGDYVYTRHLTFHPDSSLSSISSKLSQRLIWYQEEQQLVIQIPDANHVADLEIYDLRGIQVWKGRYLTDQVVISVSNWPKQPYFLKVKQAGRPLAGKIQVL